jgi:DNA-binding transcriptional MerR regulator
MPAGMRSGALARATGVSADTLRYYERRGLLPRPPRDASGYRRYPPDAVQRVIVIQRALDAGFSLAELSRILKLRDAGGAPCREVFAIAAGRLHDLDDKIASLIDLRDRLGKVVSDWRRTLDATPAGTRARLLDTLGTALPTRSARAERGLRRRRRFTRPSG